MRDRIMDLIFLIGVLFKGIDGLLELVGGTVLLFVSPRQLQGAASAITAGELREDPHDLLSNLLVNNVTNLGSGGMGFFAAYLLLHGVVKVAIVVALLVGSRRIYPWAVAALGAFLLVQIYALVTSPTIGVALLTVFDAVIIGLTWREWRHGRTLHETMRSTTDWAFRHTPA